MKKSLKWLGFIVIVLFSLFALLINIARAITPYLNHQQAFLTHWVTHLVAQKVKMREVKISWQGFNPIINFKDLSIKNASAEPLLTIGSLTLNISTFYSLWHREILPSHISLHNALIEMRTFDVSLNNNSIAALHNNLFQWLLNQAVIDFKNVDVKLHTPGAFYLIKGLNLSKEKMQKFSNDLNLKVSHLNLNQDFFLNLIKKYQPQLLLKKGYLDVNFLLKWQNKKLNKINIILEGSQLVSNTLSVDKLQANANINWADKTGSMIFKGQTIEFFPSDLFNHPLYGNALRANFNWKKDANNLMIKASDIGFEDGNLQLKGAYQLNFPKKGSPILDGLFNFNLANLKDLSHYIPEKKIPFALNRWFDQAFLQGKIEKGLITFHGPVDQFPFKEGQGNFNAIMRLNKVTLHYAPKWPNLSHFNALVAINNNDMTINVPKSTLMNNIMRNTVAEIRDLSNAELVLKTNTVGSLENQLKFLKSTPLIFARSFKNWQAAGNAHTDLKLKIKLNQGNFPAIAQGGVNIQDGELYFSQWKQNLTDINGKINFNNELISSENLTAKWLNSPLKVDMYTAAQNKINNLVFLLGGKINFVTLKEKLKWPLLSFLNGSSDYRAKLLFPQNQLGELPVFTLVSDLKGAALQLPAPLYKNKRVKKHFWLKFKDKQIFVRYGDQLSLALQLAKDNFNFFSAKLHLGPGMAQISRKEGYFIYGNLQTLNCQDWENYFNRQWDNSLLPTLRRLALHVGNLKIGAYEFPKVDLNLLSEKNKWALFLQSPKMTGKVYIPFQANEEWIGSFQQLKLKKQTNAEINLIKNPQTLPPLSLKIANFNYNNKDVGKIFLKTASNSKGLEIKNLIINSPLFYFAASGEWDEINNDMHASLAGKFNSPNLGALLQQWNITDLLVGGNGAAYFKLNWDGGLLDFSQENLNGALNLDFKVGRIIHLSKAVDNKIGLGRILNLLSLQSWPQNFLTDLFSFSKKGFNFSELSSNVKFTTGIAEITNASLVGPVAWVNSKGFLNLFDKSYNLTFEVKPNITSSIPLIVGLTGGPLAGAITWLANKVIAAPLIGKAAESTYHITGKWG